MMFWSLRGRHNADEPIRVESIVAHLTALGLLAYYPLLFSCFCEMDRIVLKHNAEMRTRAQEESAKQRKRLGEP